MIHERLYDSLIATPVSAEDAVAGDIAWASFRGLISGGLMMVVAVVMGILPVSSPAVLAPHPGHGRWSGSCSARWP